MLCAKKKKERKEIRSTRLPVQSGETRECLSQLQTIGDNESCQKVFGTYALQGDFMTEGRLPLAAAARRIASRSPGDGGGSGR